MVLFININVGQRVEVDYRYRLLTGTVKYKGGLNLMKGDWVGIELDQPLGKHNGLHRGRQYFTCKDGFGIFVHPSRIRFIRSNRMLYDSYHRVSPVSSYDGTLFTRRESPSPTSYRDPISIAESYLHTAREAFTDTYLLGNRDPITGRHLSNNYLSTVREGLPDLANEDDYFSLRRSYPLRHSVGNSLKAATMRPRSSLATLGYSSTPVHALHHDDGLDFISSPSIPKTHMDGLALTRQDHRGWRHVHRPREWSL